MFYSIKDNLDIYEYEPDSDFIAIIPLEDAHNYQRIKDYSIKIPMLFMDVHFSKIEIFPDFIYGCINIPELLIHEHTGVSFIYGTNHLIFIDKNGFLQQCFDKILKTNPGNITCCGQALYQIIDFIISKDLEKMSAIQQKLAQLERDILSDSGKEPIKEITNYRSSTMRLHHYYVMLAGMCGDLSDNTDNFFDKKTRYLFSVLIKKINLSGHEAQQIWEYTSQIRDVYQQRLDVHQNNIMKVLTIVTTLFMPLTLITGWYGMNFSYMPELNWRYGYPVIITVSIIVVIILCIIFKKKKWW